MKPSWDDAPEWARWLVQSAGGVWMWLESKPKPASRNWLVKPWAMIQTTPPDEPNPDWRKTRERRPRVRAK